MGIQLQLTMTLGDLVVAGTTVLAIIGAYYAIKGTLATLTKDQAELCIEVKEMKDVQEEHSANLVEINMKVFGRRSTDSKGRERT